jgi:hypothetical protein
VRVDALARVRFELTIASPETDEAPPLADPESPDALVWLSPIDGTVWAHGDTVEGRHWLRVPGVATYRFGDNAGEAIAIPEPEAQEGAVVDAYRRAVLPMALQVHGLEVMHASAVVTRAGVAAFCGESQAGKSTFAYAMTRRGYNLWADDAVVFELEDRGGVRTFPLPFRLRLRPASASFFERSGDSRPPRPREREAEGSEDAALITAFVLAPAEREVVPEVAVERVPPAQAFPAVFANAYWFDLRETERKRQTTERYLELVARIPVFRVSFRIGLDRLATVVDAVEETLRTVVRDA